MARRSRKKTYIYKRPKWSANIKQIGEELGGDQSITATPNQYFYVTEDLCTNPVAAITNVSQTYTVKNIEVSVEISGNWMGSTQTGTSQIENVSYYIMFVPQGMTITTEYAQEHPEYIMAYQFIGSPTADVIGNGSIYPPRKIKTRLARRLNTGDKIILFIRGLNNSTSSSKFELHGMVRWWTKAN